MLKGANVVVDLAQLVVCFVGASLVLQLGWGLIDSGYFGAAQPPQGYVACSVIFLDEEGCLERRATGVDGEDYDGHYSRAALDLPCVFLLFYLLASLWFGVRRVAWLYLVVCEGDQTTAA